MELERALSRENIRAARWSLLFGNFVIGCGVMVVGGSPRGAACPSCGSYAMQMKEGCMTCNDCGHSKCG